MLHNQKTSRNDEPPVPAIIEGLIEMQLI